MIDAHDDSHAPAAGAHDAHGDHDPHGSGHDAHGEETLGPVDVTAWLTGLVGVVAGLAVAVAFALSTGLV